MWFLAILFAVALFFNIRFIVRRIFLLKDPFHVEGQIITVDYPISSSEGSASFRALLGYTVDNNNYAKKVTIHNPQDSVENSYFNLTCQRKNPKNVVFGDTSSFYNIFTFICSFFLAFALVLFLISCFFPLK